MQQDTITITPHDLFSILADKYSIGILETANTGLHSSLNRISQSKKQFYVRLKRLVDMGLIEKRKSIYKLTTFGRLIHANHLQMMDKVIPSYWQTKGVDALRVRDDFPLEENEMIVDGFIKTTNLKDVIDPTQLTSFNIIKNFDHLIPEVLKFLDNADKEVYFATEYHDPDISNLVFRKFAKGVTIHILDGNPEQISVEKKLAAIIRTPPNKETAELIKKIVRSSRFDLKKLPDLPISFMVVDGIQIVYESVNFSSPEEFNVAISKYDDPYLAEQFIEYFKLLSKNSSPTNLLQHVQFYYE